MRSLIILKVRLISKGEQEEYEESEDVEAKSADLVMEIESR
jgi:hypothetical protein